MKRLTCAKCGSVDFLKKGDPFACRTCGRKYSASKVTKMISREKPAGKVKSSDISLAENNFRMVKKAFAVGDYKEADYICNKAIKVDKTDWKTWFIKGRAVGRRSTFDRSRIPEAIHAFSRALQYCPEEEREPLKTACKEELKVMQSALLSKRIQYFKRRPDDGNISGLRSDVNLILTTLTKFFSDTGISADARENAEYARIINNEIVDAWQTVYKDYIGNRGCPTDADLARFLSRGQYLLEALQMALPLCGETDEDESINALKIQIYENLIWIQKRLISSRSYQVKFDLGYPYYLPSDCLTKEAKAARRAMVRDWKEKVSYLQTTG